MIRHRRQLRALASPVRQAIIDIVAAVGSCATKDIAALMGRPASATYHHVNSLVRAGLLIRRRTSSGRGRPGSLLDVPGRPMMIRYAPRVAGTGPPMRRIVGAMTRAAARDFAKGYRADVTVSGPARQLWAARSEVWLTAAELRKVNRALTRLFVPVNTNGPRRDASAQRYALTFVLAPLS